MTCHSALQQVTCRREPQCDTVIVERIFVPIRFRHIYRGASLFQVRGDEVDIHSIHKDHTSFRDVSSAFGLEHLELRTTIPPENGLVPSLASRGFRRSCICVCRRPGKTGQGYFPYDRDDLTRILPLRPLGATARREKTPTQWFLIDPGRPSWLPMAQVVFGPLMRFQLCHHRYC